MVVFVQSGRIRAKVIIFGQKLYSSNVVVFRQKLLYSDKVVVGKQKWLYLGKVVVLGQSGCIRA